jgi:hypothetical protein
MAVRNVISKDFNEEKCPCCNWRVSRRYSFEESDIDKEGLCGSCFMDMIVEEGMTINTKEEGDGIMAKRILFSVSESYVQEQAKERIGRELTEEELHSVSKGLDSGIGWDLDVVLGTAIDEAVEICKK